MHKIHGWTFTDSGKYHDVVIVDIPDGCQEVPQIQEYVENNFKQHPGLSLVFPLDDPWIYGKGYPFMIPGSRRK